MNLKTWAGFIKNFTLPTGRFIKKAASSFGNDGSAVGRARGTIPSSNLQFELGNLDIDIVSLFSVALGLNTIPAAMFNEIEMESAAIQLETKLCQPKF